MPDGNGGRVPSTGSLFVSIHSDGVFAAVSWLVDYYGKLLDC